MGTVTSRELKNRTGEIMRRVRRGERIAVTNRGRRVAIILPSHEAESMPVEESLSCEEAWADMIAALERTRPASRSWRDALSRSRRRG